MLMSNMSGGSCATTRSTLWFARLGARATKNLTGSLAVFVLDFDSELLFVGDAGTTEPSRPSRRVGMEWTNKYRPVPWLTVDLDVAYTRARFTDFDPAGDRIPGAPAWVASAAVTFGGETGWFGALKARYFGPRVLIEGDSVRSLQSLIFKRAPATGSITACGCSLMYSISSTRTPTRSNIIFYRDCRVSRSAASPIGMCIPQSRSHSASHWPVGSDYGMSPIGTFEKCRRTLRNVRL